jgi:hypothetical protein
MEKIGKFFLFGLLIIIIAAVIDFAFFQNVLPGLVSVISYELNIILFGAEFTIPKIGAFTSLFSISLLTFILFIPFKEIKSKEKWKNNLLLFSKTIFYILLLPVLMLIGGFLYKLLKDSLPDFVCTIFESFGLAPKIFFGAHEFTKLNGSLASFVGLLLGLYYIYRKIDKNKV